MMSLTLSLHVGARTSLSTGEPLWGRVITYSVESALKMGLRLAAQYNGWQVYMEVVTLNWQVVVGVLGYCLQYLARLVTCTVNNSLYKLHRNDLVECESYKFAFVDQCFCFCACTCCYDIL